MGIILIAAAYLLNFQSERTPNIILFVAGSLGLLYSLLTKYKMGVIKIIPINIHLMLDTILGTFLAASPWLFGFADKVFLPHLVLGLNWYWRCCNNKYKTTIQIRPQLQVI